MDKKSTYGLKPEQLSRILSIGSEKAESDSTTSEDIVEKSPSQSQVQPQIEGYEILSKLGESGQGQIWRALQASTDRHVALKVPKGKMGSSEKALARFEREVELAASLKHPNIARIHDSGIHQGIYYYTMDLIEGMHLDEYVKQHSLTTRQILELMWKICQAIQYAHQKGVIQRDLKPSNIIVTEDGQPFIVDFGLAKNMIEDDLSLKVSRDGEAAGTPAYMSPEQAAGHMDKLDTRTDVYSLGVMLFTLLTGDSPHDLSGSRYKVMRRIAEEQVRRPRKICPKIDKELEILLLKALDNDPDRRYATAGVLAQDIDNYLTRAPLLAVPQSSVYKLKKFVRRNRALVIGAGIILVVLVVGIVVSTLFAIKADHARAEAQAVSEFLRYSVLRALDPFWIGGKEITIRSVIDTAAESLEDKFTGPPLAEAEIRHTLGFAYWSLGSYELAELHYKRAIEVCRAHLGTEHPTTLQWMDDLGGVYFYQSRYSEAEQLRVKALIGFRSALGEKHEFTLHSMWTLASVYYMQGRFYEAEQLSVKVLDAFLHKYGEENKRTVDKMFLVAWGYWLQGRYDEAEQLLTKGLNISRSLRGETDYWTLAIKHLFGELCCNLGRYDKAEQLLLMALKGRRQAWGQKHPDTLQTKVALGWLYHSQSQYKEAESLFMEALDASRRVLGDEHLLSLLAKHGLGASYLSQGRYEDAEALLIDAFEMIRGRMGEKNWVTLNVMNTVARLYTPQSRQDDAEHLFHEALDARKLKLGEDHPETLESKNDLAVLYKEQERYHLAEPLLIEAVEGRRLKLGDTHPHTLESWNNLIELYEAWNKPEKAEESQEKLPRTEAVNE
jgi:tetratricopeptide (TPR) repeat protein